MTTATPPHLGDPTFVQITLRKDNATVSWSVLKDLLCQRSKYFHGAFNFDGTEKASGVYHIPNDVSKSTVISFIRWLYFQRIYFEHGRTAIHDGNINQALDLYFFADRYDTLLLRRDCLDLFFDYMKSHRVSESSRRRARLWSSEFLDRLDGRLPESSPLSRLIADDEVSNVEFESAEEAADWIEKTPAKWAGKKLVLDSKRQGREVISLCDYHEHGTSREGDVCDGFGAQLVPKRDID